MKNFFQEVLDVCVITILLILLFGLLAPYMVYYTKPIADNYWSYFNSTTGKLKNR